MRTIRRNTFETNSSSTHSVTICTASSSFAPIDYTGRVLTVEPGEFGWEEDFYSDFLSKASYAYTYAVNYGTEENLEELKEVLLEYTNAKEVVLANRDDSAWYGTGYIDHQSTDEAAQIFETRDDLKHFLFNDCSNFITDNDNH